jgi:AcrR family transcriptional regulator
MGKRATRAADLREACIREALAIIELRGAEQLSLREVARRLGVSHQAPYRHFPSRDHLLAEIVARAFDAFAQALAARAAADDPSADLANMCRAYLDFAAAHPLQFRLMFGGLLPDPDAHPHMLAKARDAFALLAGGIARLPAHAAAGSAEGIALDALFAWATVHGLASILRTGALAKLEMPGLVLRQLVPHVLARMNDALRPPITP